MGVERVRRAAGGTRLRGGHGTAPARLRGPQPAPRGGDRRWLVVFVGTGDDSRSLVAAALAAHCGGGRVQAMSMSPRGQPPDPVVVEALAEIGVDLSRWRSWPPSHELLRRADAVVVLGLDPQGLVPESLHPEDWLIDDPGGKPLDVVRHLRDALDRRTRRLLTHLPAREEAGR